VFIFVLFVDFPRSCLPTEYVRYTKTFLLDLFRFTTDRVLEKKKGGFSSELLKEADNWPTRKRLGTSANLIDVAASASTTI
jgi:hypothetical protein